MGYIIRVEYTTGDSFNSYKETQDLEVIGRILMY